MRSFLLSSILVLLLGACKKDLYKEFTRAEPAGAEVNTPYHFISEQSTVIYKTGADIYGHYLSGLLFIKRTNDDDHRIIFTTEMGVKLFDMAFEGDKFKVYYCMKKLNKKPVINLLEKDFALMLMRDLNKGQISYWRKEGYQMALPGIHKHNELQIYHFEQHNITIAETFMPSGKEKVKIVYDAYNEQNMPGSVIIDHKNIKLNIKLDLLKQ